MMFRFFISPAWIWLKRSSSETLEMGSLALAFSSALRCSTSSRATGTRLNLGVLRRSRMHFSTSFMAPPMRLEKGAASPRATSLPMFFPNQRQKYRGDVGKRRRATGARFLLGNPSRTLPKRPFGRHPWPWRRRTPEGRRRRFRGE